MMSHRYRHDREGGPRIREEKRNDLCSMDSLLILDGTLDKHYLDVAKWDIISPATLVHRVEQVRHLSTATAHLEASRS